jgi:hypothetical protein
MFIEPASRCPALRQEGNVYRTRIEMSRPPSGGPCHPSLAYFSANPNIIDYTLGTWVAEKLGGRRWPTHLHKSTFKRSLPLP